MTKLNIYTFGFLLIQLLFVGVVSLSPFTMNAAVNENFYVSTYYAIPSGNDLVLKGRVSYPPKYTRAWFRWGETPYMEYSTTPVRLSYIKYRREIDLTEKISNVEKNTTYYYQLIAETIEGNRVYGEKLNTTTEWEGKDSLPDTKTTETESNNTGYFTNVVYSSTSASPTSPIAVTLLPSPIYTNGAELKGLALPGSTITTDGWFEWGPSNSLGNTTIRKNIANDTRPITFSDTIAGLSPNTTYYYRAVIKNRNGISYGNILSFKTNPQYTATVSTQKTTTQPVNTTKKEIAVKTKKEETNTIKNNSLASTVASGNNNFMPDTLIEWLILLLVILGILALSDYLYTARKKRKEESEEKKS